MQLLAATTVSVVIAAGALIAAMTPPRANAATVSGTLGAVAAEHRLASAAGVEILRSGGNAVDAAVAAALVGGLVNPSSAGLGGGGFMVIYLAAEDRIYTLDYREAAPGRAHRDMYVRDGRVETDASKRGGLAVAVPGEAAGLEMALERFGKLGMSRVAAPAIRLAREGFRVEAHLAASIARHSEALGADRALAAAFLHEDGQGYREGELLVRHDLAAALTALAEEGSAPFYTGAIAQAIVTATQQAGGIIEPADLSAYRPRTREAVVVRYRRWRIAGMAPPSSGGGVIGTALKVLEPYSLDDLGIASATYIHLLAETMKAVFADRAAYYGDPEFFAVPTARLISASHATEIRARLRPDRSVPASLYGHAGAAADAGTAHISVIDAAGNAVAATTSINTGFGAKVGVPGYGLVLNNTMDDFSLRPGVANVYGLVGSEANSIAAGKRPLSSMSPTLVLGDGGVRLAVGGSGGPLIISATLQTLINVLDFAMDVGAAVDASRIHHQWTPDRLGVEPDVAEVVRSSLGRLGHDVDVMHFAGAVEAVEVVSAGGQRRIRAAADERKGGVAAAQ